MMRVYLVRHAIAHERDSRRWPEDSQRPLTAAGRQRFRKAAAGLVQLIPRRAKLLTSPFVRARDTAVLLVRTGKYRKQTECAALSAGRAVQEALHLLREHEGEAHVVLVGHEPNLSRLLSAVLGGTGARLRFEFKKGGAACLEFPRKPAVGQGTLLWFMPPRQLRKLR